jgi:hypothetical protein
MFLYILSLYFYVMIRLAIGIICKPSLLPFSSMNNIFCYHGIRAWLILLGRWKVDGNCCPIYAVCLFSLSIFESVVLLCMVI